MNVESVLAMRRKNKGIAGSSRQGSAKLDSSVRRAPPVAEGAHPRSRPHPKGDKPDSSNCGSGSGPTPPPKRIRLTGAEPVLYGQGKPLCPHLYTTDNTKDLWCNPEFGAEITRHNVRAVDMAYLGPHSSEEIADSVFIDLARIPAAVQSLENRARGYEKMQARVEEYEGRCQSLTQELEQLRLDHDTSRKQFEEQLSNVREELKAEIDSGRRFLETLGGQRFMKQEADRVISVFKGSVEFIEAVQEAAIPAFNTCFEYCRKRLIDSGRFPGETFEFLDPDWVEMTEDDSTTVIASHGASLLPTAPENDTMDLGCEDAT